MVHVAVTQLCSSGAILSNLATARSLIKKAAAAGARAVFLPEATDFICPAKEVAALTRSAEAKEFVKGIRDAAREHNVLVSVGIHEDPEGVTGYDDAPNKAERCFNTQLVFGNDGQELQRYRKLHLFDVDIKGGTKILESNTTIPGRILPDVIASSPTSTNPIGALGLLTCYDLRFPEPSLALRRRGAQILTYPSAFTVRTGAAHWEALLRVRAIETQTYVIAAAQAGHHEGTQRVSWGHAMIVDPYGSVIAQCSDMQPYEPRFALAEIVSAHGAEMLAEARLTSVHSQDLGRLESTRKEMPLWEQRRDDVYAAM